MTQQALTDAEWLTLREPVDATARSRELVDVLRPHLPTSGGTTIHDLGCGTGAMSRWLAPRLAGPQHWVLHDHDATLLPRATDGVTARDRAEVTTETRRQDITRLTSDDLAGASLVTASAVLDVLTAQGLERVLDALAGTGCPALLTLTVIGEVELAPADPTDREVAEAFNEHQRRGAGAGRLSGPDAVEVAIEGLARRGREVRVRPTPWHLGPREAALARGWFAGWLGAACEQRPSLRPAAAAYARRRMTQLAQGDLTITVQHRDLLVLPPTSRSR